MGEKTRRTAGIGQGARLPSEKHLLGREGEPDA